MVERTDISVVYCSNAFKTNFINLIISGMLENFDPVFESSPLFGSIYKNSTANAIQLMDEDGYIIEVNDAFTHSFGYTSKDLYGKHIRVLFTEEDQKMQMPEMEIETVKQHGSAVDRNYTVHKDGTCVWVSGESIFAKDDKGKTFIVKFIQSIHEQKLLEKFLKESNEFSESVVKAITDALIVLDTNFRILKVNNAFYNLFQINKETIEGLHLFELNDSFLNSTELKEHLEEMVETAASTQLEHEYKEDGNIIKNLSVKTSFIDGKMVNKRILLVATDVTDKVQSDRQRDDLIAFVIHELRNPLSNIVLLNTLLEQTIQDNDKENAEEFIKKSKENAERLKSLIQELYDATKAGSGHLQFNKTNFNFDDLVKEAIETVQLTHSSHTIRKEGDVNLEIIADRERLNQALSNYLLNAIKYSPEADKVDVQLSVENGNVVVAVTDFGQGVPEEKIPHLFERYFRANDSKKIEGLGLGLFLSKQIINAHDGRVWIKSKINEGSTFYFSIPC